MKRILCIEDHPEMIDLIQLILGRRGYQVEGAVGGREGLVAIEREPPDLVLLDLMMPDLDGWEVYRQLKAKAELKNIPVIIVTAKAQGIDRVLGLHIAGVDDYIAKPFGPKELADSVERVLSSAKEPPDAPPTSEQGMSEVRGDEE
jgi:DNA-binding response OmpR family regulator